MSKNPEIPALKRSYLTIVN